LDLIGSLILRSNFVFILNCANQCPFDVLELRAVTVNLYKICWHT